MTSSIESDWKTLVCVAKRLFCKQVSRFCAKQWYCLMQNASIHEFSELWKKISNLKFVMLLQCKNTGLLHLGHLHYECS